MRHRIRGLTPAVTVLALAAVIASGAALSSGAAQAADLGPYNQGRRQWTPPPPTYTPQAFRWTGFYAGIQAGYGWGGTEATASYPFIGATEAFDYSKSGAVGGVHLGYNWQVNSLVFGLETDLEASRIRGEGIGTLASNHATGLDWMGSTRARLGFTTGATLFYLTGGVAYGGVTVDRTPGLTSSQWQTGYTLGGGVEHAFTSNISARLEYRYTDLGSVSLSNPALGVNDTTNISTNAIRAGLSFRF